MWVLRNTAAENRGFHAYIPVLSAIVLLCFNSPSFTSFLCVKMDDVHELGRLGAILCALLSSLVLFTAF